MMSTRTVKQRARGVAQIVATLLIAVASLSCRSQPIRTTPCCSPISKKLDRADGSFPGFDKRDFPGLDKMKTWMDESPYVWVGYYLPAPCFAGKPWTGQNVKLAAQGWGLAVLYVGQQAPGASMLKDEPGIA